MFLLYVYIAIFAFIHFMVLTFNTFYKSSLCKLLLLLLLLLSELSKYAVCLDHWQIFLFYFVLLVFKSIY